MKEMIIKMKEMIENFHVYGDVAISIEQAKVLIKSEIALTCATPNLNPDLMIDFQFQLSSTVDGVRLYKYLAAAIENQPVVMSTLNTKLPASPELISSVKNDIKLEKGSFQIIATAKQLADILIEVNTHTNFDGLRTIDKLKESDEMTNNEPKIVDIENGFYVQEDFELALGLAGATFENGGFLNIHIATPSPQPSPTP